MNKIREWGFPVSLLVAWLVVSTYTLSALSRLPPGTNTQTVALRYSAAART